MESTRMNKMLREYFNHVELSDATMDEMWKKIAESTVPESDTEKSVRNSIKWSTHMRSLMAAAVFVCVAGGGVWAYQHTTVPHASSSGPQAKHIQANTTTTYGTTPHGKHQTGNSTSSTAALTKEPPFQAIVPSTLPKGYQNYTSQLLNSGSNHQTLYLTYPGPLYSKNGQYISIDEFPVANHKTPQAVKGTPSHETSVSGTKITIYFPNSNPKQYWFVKSGLFFSVTSCNNTTDVAMAFVKSLILEGVPLH